MQNNAPFTRVQIATKEWETHFHRARSYQQSLAKHNWDLSQSWESQFQFFICLFLMTLLCLHTVTGSEKSSNETVQLFLLRSNLLPPKWHRLAGLQISNSELLGQQVTVTIEKYWDRWSSCNITFPGTCRGPGKAERMTCLPALDAQTDYCENRTRRDETSLQGTKPCWSLLNYPHTFEKVVSKPWRSQAWFDQGVSPCTGCKVTATALSRSSSSQAGLSEERDPGSQKQRLLQAACSPSILQGGIWLSGSFCEPVLLSYGSLQLSSPQQRNQSWDPAVFREAAPGLQRDWRYTCRAGGPCGRCWWAPTNTGSTPEKQQL